MRDREEIFEDYLVNPQKNYPASVFSVLRCLGALILEVLLDIRDAVVKEKT